MTAPAPDLPTRETLAAEVKRVTHAWSGPSMDDFLNDAPTRKQLAIADAVLALVSEAVDAVTAERDQARQMIANAPHGATCEVMRAFRPSAPCECWKAGL